MAVDVLLAGLQLPETENHTLAALAHAGAQQGIEVRCMGFRGWTDIPRIVDEVRRSRPGLFGVSIQTSEAALVSLALCRRLRDADFSGRIVCGGHFSTLNAHDIVASAAGVDAVVRFAGDRALPMLARAADDEALSGVPGLVFRDAGGRLREGAPADVDDVWFLSRSRAVRDLPRHLGYPAADLVSTHGCEHHCSYCCIAGSEQLALDERRRAGLPAEPRRRDPTGELDGLVDEISGLYHEHGARVFNVMDDNVVPDGPAAAAAWAESLDERLRGCGVERIAVTLQVRADAIDDRSARALATLGVVRSYVGIDGFSQARLVSLGRRAEASAGRRALAMLTGHGILCVANALLIGPTLSFASLAGEIEGIAAIEHGPIHLLPIDVRAGTTYDRRARAQGLVEGSFLWPRYRFADPRTAQLAELVVAIEPRLALRSVPIGLYDLAYNLGIARRLLPELDLDDAVLTYARISAAWNREQVRFLRAAHAVVEAGDAHAGRVLVQDTLRRTEELDRPWLAEIDGWVEGIETVVGAHRQIEVHAHTRGRLLGAVALSLSLTACGPGSIGASSTTGESGSDDIGVTTADTDSSGSGMDSSGSDMDSSDSGMDSSGSDTWSRKFDLGDTGEPFECADPRLTALPESELPYEGANACLSDEYSAYVIFDENGVAVDFVYGLDPENPRGQVDPPDPEVIACLAALFAGVCYPSLAGMSVLLQQPHFWIA